MNFKKLIMIGVLSSFCFGQDNLVIEKSIEIFEVSLKDLDAIVNGNYDTSDFKPASNSIEIEFNNNLNDSIVKDSSFYYHKNISANRIKAHNELSEIMKENLSLTDLDIRDKNKVIYFLNLLKLNDNDKGKK